VCLLVDQGSEPQRPAAADDLGREASSDRDRIAVDAPARVELIGERDQVRDPVVQGDVHVLRLEHRRQPLADELDDRLEIELLRKRVADLVDDRQLSRACIRLGEKLVRLVEQPRVLEGHAHARGNRRDEALIGLAEGVLGA